MAISVSEAIEAEKKKRPAPRGGEPITESLHRRSASARRKAKLAKTKAHRGTNFAKVKGKPGYKRVKMGNRYVLMKMSPKERASRKKTARQLKRIKR